ncbi:hypothetical protein Tco_0547887 [Tanacetum coccineum]
MTICDTHSVIFTDVHALDYSSPPLWDDNDDELFDLETVNDNTYDDPFDFKKEKIKDAKLLIDELDPPRSSKECKEAILIYCFFKFLWILISSLLDILSIKNSRSETLLFVFIRKCEKVFNPDSLLLKEFIFSSSGELSHGV